MQRIITANGYDTEHKLLLKEKEICYKIVAKRNNEVNNLNNKIKYDKLKYYFQSEDTLTISLNGFKGPLGLIRKIKNSSM